jgi:hypothetical protein
LLNFKWFSTSLRPRENYYWVLGLLILHPSLLDQPSNCCLCNICKNQPNLSPSTEHGRLWLRIERLIRISYKLFHIPFKGVLFYAYFLQCSTLSFMMFKKRYSKRKDKYVKLYLSLIFVTHVSVFCVLSVINSIVLFP